MIAWLACSTTARQSIVLKVYEDISMAVYPGKNRQVWQEIVHAVQEKYVQLTWRSAKRLPHLCSAAGGTCPVTNA